MFQHHRTVAELLNQAVPSLDCYITYSDLLLDQCPRIDSLAYDISATLSLLYRFLEDSHKEKNKILVLGAYHRCPARALTN